LGVEPVALGAQGFKLLGELRRQSCVVLDRQAARHGVALDAVASVLALGDVAPVLRRTGLRALHL
jgi:hypothetical protein